MDVVDKVHGLEKEGFFELLVLGVRDDPTWRAIYLDEVRVESFINDDVEGEELELAVLEFLPLMESARLEGLYRIER